ncbi:MAG: malate dehydrogenase [candidate division WOR-3 bacterium]|nr:MAG: malate dehydrogenase [candidate division WOR-3 bacterium]
MKKVTIIGAGNVGSSVALYLAEHKIADIYLVDVVEGLPEGKALDAEEAAPIRRYDVELRGCTDFSCMVDSDIVVITAGIARRPGMSRDDLLNTNAKIIKSVSEKVAQYAPNSIIIMVTNPLDVMAYLALKTTGFALKRVVGMAGILDSIRFRYFVAQKFGVSVIDTTAMVLGGHGDSMVPLPRYSTIGGVPITELMPKDDIDKIIERTRKGGAEIVGYLKTGSAYYAPAAAVAKMVECIVRDKRRILPCSAYLRGEYGIDGLFVGVPVMLGMNGVEKIIELELIPEEREALHTSASAVKTVIEKLENLGLF